MIPQFRRFTSRDHDSNDLKRKRTHERIGELNNDKKEITSSHERAMISIQTQFELENEKYKSLADRINQQKLHLDKTGVLDTEQLHGLIKDVCSYRSESLKPSTVEKAESNE